MELLILVDNNSLITQIAANNINVCTTKVTDMSNLFRNNTTFNLDISFWDTSNVTNMSGTFNGATII